MYRIHTPQTRLKKVKFINGKLHVYCSASNLSSTLGRGWWGDRDGGMSASYKGAVAELRVGGGAVVDEVVIALGFPEQMVGANLS